MSQILSQTLFLFPIHPFFSPLPLDNGAWKSTPLFIQPLSPELFLSPRWRYGESYTPEGFLALSLFSTVPKIKSFFLAPPPLEFFSYFVSCVAA